MFEDVRQYDNIVQLIRLKVLDKFRVYLEASRARNPSCPLIKLQTFRIETVPGVKLESTSFITTYIQQPSPASLRMEGCVSIQKGPESVPR
jgi:hypothetical protein